MTSTKEMDVVEMVLGGVINGEIVRTAGAAGFRAIGIRGSDASLMWVTPGKDSRTATADAINPQIIHDLWRETYLPILAPIGIDQENQAININADECAQAVAIALGQDEETQLCYLSDVPGVCDATGRPIAVIPTNQLDSLIAAGTITGGMIAKVRSAIAAVEAGVANVHIASWTQSGDLGKLLAGKLGSAITAMEETE